MSRKKRRTKIIRSKKIIYTTKENMIAADWSDSVRAFMTSSAAGVFQMKGFTLESETVYYFHLRV